MFGELVEWVLNLDREFAFLLSLPFLVAIAGLLAEGLRKREKVHKQRARHSASFTHFHNLWSRGL
jgi:hypothetical protein